MPSASREIASPGDRADPQVIGKYLADKISLGRHDL
jgi:hypothetical protein